MEVTIEQVNEAVGELRAEMKKAFPDEEKLARIDKVLDAQEELNQAHVQANLRAEAQAEEIKSLKDELEKKGVAEGEIRTQVEALELALAHAGNSQDPDYREGPEFKAFESYFRKGEKALEPDEFKTLRTDSGPDGGFLVPVEMDNMIQKKIVELDPIRAVARVRTISAKSMEMAIRASIPTATYEGEAEEGADSQSAYENKQVVPFRQTFTTPITRDMLQDAAFDMEAEIVSDASEAFAFGEGNGFVVGTGFKQPEGITVNAALVADARGSGVSATITPENLIDLEGDIKVGYSPVWLFNRRTLAAIRKFRAAGSAPGDGPFLWSPGFQDRSIQGIVGNTLNGLPYVLANSMPDLGSSTIPVALGDWRRCYTITDRQGLSIIRDDLAQKRKAIVEFTMQRWNTGQITLEDTGAAGRVARLLQCDA